jgi:outer membrane protein assembly factor BamC
MKIGVKLMLTEIKRLLLISSLLSIVSCSTVDKIKEENPIRNRANDYLYSKETLPMVAPKDAAIGELYIVPEVPVSGLPSKSFSTPRPQPLSMNLLEESIEILSFSGKQWIAINKPPAEVWPRLRSVLTRSGVPTAKMDPPEGILDTGWLQFKDDEQNSHRFRFFISPGVGVRSSEIRVTQMSVMAGKESTIEKWPQASMSAEREEEFIKIIANTLVSDVTGTSVSLLAQNIGGESRVKVVIPDSEDPYIDLKLGYARSWNSVSESLSLGGFSIVSKDEKDGYFLVEFAEVDLVTEDGSLVGLVSNFLDSRRSDDEDISVLEYKITVTQEKDSVVVRILNKNDFALDQLMKIKLLKIIRGNLS